MATIKLTPSTYYSTNTSYLSVTNASNMYTDTDSTTYAQIYNNRTSTSSYYIYLRGFNFDDVPSTAEVSDFTIRLKGNYSNGSSQSMYLYNGTSTSIGSASSLSTSVTTREFSCDATWAELVAMGDDFGIRINCRRSNRNTAAYYYIYGAEIEVNYTIPVYYTVASSSVVSGVTTSPSSQSIREGNDAVVTINASAIDGIKVTDNDIDVTSQLVQHVSPSGGTIERYPASYTTSGSISGTRYQSTVGCGVDNYSTQTGNDYASGGSGSTAIIYYHFNFDDIPDNATIESMTVQALGHLESTSNSSERAELNTYYGTTAKGTTVSYESTDNETLTIPAGTWTVAQLKDDARVGFTIGYYGGLTVGITWEVTYSIPATGNPYYWTYTISNVSTDHVVLIEENGPIIPPEEDPTYNYYPITISSINAVTAPANGTTRVQEGTTQVITITPTDPQLTLALDNGVDITSQLQGGVPSNTYTIDTQVSGASYGFNLNSSTGYYVSTNDGVARSASVARLNMDFESECLVTIQYINYAEEDYDYGMFGKLDTEVATDGLSASSGSSSPSDSTSNYEIARCTNSTSTQTVTYEVPIGQHFIDIKYGKDDASDSGYDNLQWKVLSIEATSAGGEYTYTLTNINQKHSLIFIFGNVDYYYITSSGNACKLYPDGQIVKLDGDSYRLTIIPNDPDATVSILDNGINRTSLLTKEEGQDKNGNKIVNYIYSLSNINAAHTLTVTCSSSEQTTKIFFKNNSGVWTQYSKVFLKVNGAWVEQDASTWSRLFDTSLNYRIL